MRVALGCLRGDQQASKLGTHLIAKIITTDELLVAPDAPEVDLDVLGSPHALRNGSVLVDWEQSINQITGGD